MKKVCLLLLALLCILPAVIIGTAADDEKAPEFVVESVKAFPGETVTVTVSIRDSVQMTSMSVRPIYPEDKLTFVGSEWLLTDAALKEGGSVEDSSAVLAFSERTAVSGNILTMRFIINESVEIGTEIEVSVEAIVKVIRDGGEETTFKSEDKSVLVENGYISVVENASTIKCAQVSLGTDISVNYYADVIAADEGAQMRFTMNGKETLVDGTFDEEYGLYVFPFTGITPQCMGDTIKAELIKDDKVLAAKDDYSVLQNCKNLLGKTADELGLTDDQYAAMETLIADLMEYGAAAQIYRGYKTDSLMNKDETIAALTPTEFVKWTNRESKAILSEPEDSEDENILITAAGLFFDYQNSIYVKFYAPDLTAENFAVVAGRLNEDEEIDEPAVYTLNDATHPFLEIGENIYAVILDPLAAYELAVSPETDDYVWFRITLNQVADGKLTEIQCFDYSVASFVCRIQSETSPMANLAKALYNYGLSAANYMAAIEK